MKVRGQTVYTPIERLSRLSEIDATTGCWNWKGATRNGYGRLLVGSRSDKSRRSVSAHRLSYETFKGEVPAGMEVCHTCDNPRCVNPDHLFPGTRQDNVDDRERKGRGVYVRGEKVGTAKLTEADVRSARRLREKGCTFQEIADHLGVTKKTAMLAAKGETWAHLVPPAPGTPLPKEAVLALGGGEAGEASPDPIRQLLMQHATLIEEGNDSAYFELAYTRQTGWMAWITDKPAKGEPGTAEYAKSRKVIARGQGDSPDEACADALLAAAASTKGGGK